MSEDQVHTLTSLALQPKVARRLPSLANNPNSERVQEKSVLLRSNQMLSPPTDSEQIQIPTHHDNSGIPSCREQSSKS